MQDISYLSKKHVLHLIMSLQMVIVVNLLYLFVAVGVEATFLSSISFSITTSITTHVNTKRKIGASKRDLIVNRVQTRLKAVFNRVQTRLYIKRAYTRSRENLKRIQTRILTKSRLDAFRKNFQLQLDAFLSGLRSNALQT